MALPHLLQVSSTPNRVFGLDLLRTFAIITVLLAHGSIFIPPSLLPYYAYISRIDGVAVFFVLSGFLIGGILIRTLETKPASLVNLWNFWVKRWIRTIPPYFLALAIAMSLEVYSGAAPSSKYCIYLIFAQNLNWPHPWLYQEAWSLACEEWFYLLSAPFIFLLASFHFKPKTAVLLAVVVVIGLTTLHRYQHYLTIQPQSPAEWDEQFRKIVFMRLDSLMYGVLAAWLFYYHKGFWLSNKLIKFVIGAIWLYLQSGLSSSGVISFFECVFLFTCQSAATVLLLPLLTEWKSSSGVVSRAVTHISLISYSMYLLHSTILNNHFILPFVRLLAISAEARSVLGFSLFWGLTILCSTIMYKYFEVPVMNLRSKVTIPESVKLPAQS